MFRNFNLHVCITYGFGPDHNEQLKDFYHVYKGTVENHF